MLDIPEILERMFFAVAVLVANFVAAFAYRSYSICSADRYTCCIYNIRCNQFNQMMACVWGHVTICFLNANSGTVEKARSLLERLWESTGGTS